MRLGEVNFAKLTFLSLYLMFFRQPFLAAKRFCVSVALTFSLWLNGRGREINCIIIHCTATPEGMDIGAKEIRRHHVRNLGWHDIGYHYVIRLDGSIEQGRDPELAGAHCRGHNAHSIGIVYVGGLNSHGLPEDSRTEEQKASLKALVGKLRERYPDATVHGHCEFSSKACPCFNVREEFGE